MIVDPGPALVYETSGELVPIGPGGVLVGRGSACSLRLADATVSKQHAQVVADAGVHRVVDLGSTNGTYVNGVKVTTRALADGDHVRFGATPFRYRLSASALLEPHAPDRRLTRELALVARLSTEVLGHESERAVIRATADALVEAIGADRVCVGFGKEGRETVEVALIRTRPNLDPRRAAGLVPHTPMKSCMKTRRTYCPSTEPGEQPITSASMRAASLGSIVVVPLVARGNVFGAIQAERLDMNAPAFDEVDVLVSEIVGNLLAGSLETARLYRYAPARDGQSSSPVSPEPRAGAAAAGPHPPFFGVSPRSPSS